MITIVLTYPHTPLEWKGEQGYKVVQIDQSTEFKPGEFLKEQQVKDLCELPKKYKVSIRPVIR